MPTMTQKTTTYTYALQEIVKLIAADLNVPLEALDVRYNLLDSSDDRFGGGYSPSVHDITVTVDMTKAKDAHLGGSQGVDHHQR